MVIMLAALFVGRTQGEASSTPVDRGTDASRADLRAKGFLRGMTVSCPRAGQIWGSPAMTEALDELAGLGVDWVAIHPYAGVRRDGTVRFTPAADVGYLDEAVRRARAADIALFWKPHLAYWGSFAWRGDVAFGEDEAAWTRFFTQYRAFIVDHARFAERHGIRLFAVGVELEATTTSHEAQWRAIIAEIRQVYSGTITYAANWDQLDAVPFWDALDWIGVQAYFPLSHEDAPTSATLMAGWEQPLRQLRALSAGLGDKPVLFAEIGYDQSPDAAREPWRTNSQQDDATLALRRQLIQVALDRIEREPFMAGMFWWKWMPGEGHWYDDHDRDFAMRHPDARALLRRAWGSAPEAQAASPSRP